MPAGAVAASDHVLIGAADICRYDLEDDAVVDRLSRRIAEGRKVYLLNFDATAFEVNDVAVGVRSHLQSPLPRRVLLSCRVKIPIAWKCASSI